MTNNKILKVLIKAKELYVNERSTRVGMCSCIRAEFEYCFKMQGLNYSSLKTLIPEFNPEFLNGDYNEGYWWSILDYKSRIKAFNRLIRIYSNKIRKEKTISFIKRFINFLCKFKK